MSRGGWLAVAGIALLAALGSAVASSRPDGLERVAEDLGFADRAEVRYQAPAPDYAVPGVPFGGALAGLAGATVVGGLAAGVGAGLRRTRS